MDLGVSYIIGKLLKFRCLKWVCMTHLNIWSTNYGQKKGLESNWQFDSRPLKVKKFRNFFVCRCRATYRWKSLDKGYKFSLDLIAIGALHTKLWAPKLQKSQLWEFRDSHVGVMGENAIWMWASWIGTKYIIRGKVVASPKFGSWWVLWVHVCSWLVLTPKVFKLCTNQLVVWFVQIYMSDEVLVILPSPILKLQHTPLPQSVVSQGMCPTPSSFVVFTSYSHLNLSNILGACQLGSWLGRTSQTMCLITRRPLFTPWNVHATLIIAPLRMFKFGISNAFKTCLHAIPYFTSGQSHYGHLDDGMWMVHTLGVWLMIRQM